MIFDTIENLGIYETVLPAFRIVAAYLAKTDCRTLTAGKHELLCGIYLNVNDYTPASPDVFEGHTQYIDLQYLYAGEEAMEWTPLASCSEKTKEDAESDYTFYKKAENVSRIHVKAGQFTVFFPQDAHRPGIAETENAAPVRKLIFKIPVPQKEDERYLLQILPQIAMPQDAVSDILSAFGKFPPDRIRSAEARFFAGESIEADVRFLSETAGITPELCNLTLYLLFGRHTVFVYLDLGFDLCAYLDSMTDFTIWEKVCKNKLGHPGLLETGWLAATLKAAIIRVGRFQYERTRLHFSGCTVDGESIENGTPVLNIHIPEGAPIPRDVREDSYRRAYAYFDRYPRHNGSLVFTCESWLFYAAHRTFLQEGSNIVDFMNDFKMLESYEKYGDLGNMWRVFGFPADISDFPALPEKTGMQRAYKKHLTETGCTGEAYGIFLYDGKNFRR